MEKIKEALKTRWANQLGIKDDKVFEGVAISVKPFITSDEQLTQFVEGAKDMLTNYQSAADKVRTELNAKIKGLEGEKADLEAKLNGKPNPEPKPQDPPKPAEPQPQDMAKIIADAVAAAVKPLSDEIAGFKAAKAKEDAVTALDKFINEWDYAEGFPKERDMAKHIAMKVYKAGGETMNGEQLIAAFREEFDPAVKDKGVTDFSKPFQSNGGGGDNSFDASGWEQTMKDMGWEVPKEN